MASLIVTADTSVVVPALADWHPEHKRSLGLVRDVRRLPGHVLIETVSVLTRMRHGVASPIAEVVLALAQDFPDEPLTLDPGGYRRLLTTFAATGIAGGRVYDALVGASAAAAGARLLTADRRALPTYAAVGATAELAF
ncbi:PIN domain-containing protein [Candidatus Protofrankia californiensis]|uniref:PIN domain-containing protein n=1 Tax=Candidatus Protofrankia californiensis TaxID=1839754 RepID=UPI0010419364|nr:PIN domain-containing protein [Candidatus Protofrankia californiensis]